jgi:hypothetical protein
MFSIGSGLCMNVHNIGFIALSTYNVYKEYCIPRVCPLVGIGTLPTPLSRQRVCPQPKMGGGHTHLRVRGWGSPNSDDWRKGLALCLLCGFKYGRESYRTPYSIVISLLCSLLYGVLYIYSYVHSYYRISGQKRFLDFMDSVELRPKSMQNTGVSVP